jgi:hypothetical protein
MSDTKSTAEQLVAVAAWLTSLGLGNGSDRLHRYISEIQKPPPISPPASFLEVAQWGFVHLEVFEFISIYKAYKKSEDAILIGKLEKVLKGCPKLVDESPKNNDPRNTMFELALAAELKLRGVDVQLCEPDLMVTFPKGQYGIACKRPYNEGGVKRNVRDAKDQLQANLKSDQHGVIATSLSRIVNPGNRLLGVHVGSRSTEGAIHGSLQVDLHRHSVELMKRLGSISFSSKTLALMFDISTPCLVENGDMHFAHASQFYPIDEPKRIVSKFRGFRQIPPAFTYLDDIMGDEVLNATFSPDAQAEIDRMNRNARMSAKVVPIIIGE